MEQLSIKLDAFEGPMELLLHLIDKNKLDIYDIPIASLTDQYMEYISTFSVRDMENLSEFIVMAATLLEIKSKMLLPVVAKGIDGEIDPREELVNKLIEYKRYRGVLGVFKHQEEIGEKYVYKGPDKEIVSMFAAANIVNIEDVLDGVTIERLFAIFDDVLRRRESKTDVVRSSFSSVKKDVYTLEEKTRYILDLIILNKKVRFTELFDYYSSKTEKVVTFLAVLELVKQKEINIRQDQLFEDIYIVGKTE